MGGKLRECLNCWCLGVILVHYKYKALLPGTKIKLGIVKHF